MVLVRREIFVIGIALSPANKKLGTILTLEIWDVPVDCQRSSDAGLIRYR